MNATECAEVLRAHNEWRRGGEGDQTEPKNLGMAIDTAIGLVERHDELSGQLSSLLATCEKAIQYQWPYLDATA